MCAQSCVCYCHPYRLLPDKRLFETKRKDQLNALKNLVELNDINQQYKIIDIMLKGLFKVLAGLGPASGLDTHTQGCGPGLSLAGLPQCRL